MYSHRNNCIARLFEKLLANVNVLSWKGLVNKKDIHVLKMQACPVVWSGGGRAQQTCSELAEPGQTQSIFIRESLFMQKLGS